MPIFIERYVLPFLAAVTVVILVTNPMLWELRVRVAASVAVISIAFVVSRMLHRYNRAQHSKSGADTTKQERLLVPSEVTVEQISYPFQELTQVQAIRATERYIGKWMRYSGKITNIVRENAIFLVATENQRVQVLIEEP